MIVSGIVLLILIILFYLDFRLPAYKRALFMKKYRNRNIAYGITSILVVSTLQIINQYLDGVIPRLSPLSDYFLLDLVICFLLAELINWVAHYIKHKSNFFWKFHFQHHISPNYTVLLTTHTHFLDVLLIGSLTSVLLQLIGASELSIGIYLKFYLVFNIYQHTNRPLSLGFLDRFIISPAYHKLHHAKDGDCNYGSTLTVWDVIFNKARWPKATDEDYETGIVRDQEPFSYVKEMLYFLK